ncbi:type II toxin-antitoxin system RelE/ParE family toxin [Pelagivirga sediminicola]|uniref:Toxin n=1 Tax=Pelagivirga sediminicola TaxID=2170575 RepID=A0A2T7G3S7_9RHOB|nr:type II toxin-antitoxin system RelE/ParE family toxin [Roseovarius sp. M141]PVA09084.1 type II toxin-antitoxin system RelE/ParE family toxin [Pelagivirga sediminicola]
MPHVARSYVLRPLAEQDLADIWTDGADHWGIAQADRYFDGMVELFDLLSEQPEIARLRKEFRPPVRIHIYGSHIFVFETVETGIAVIRVLHQRRDILALLGD